MLFRSRSGRQAVKAKIIIDATPRASVARMAGADFEPYPAGMQTFRRVVVGGQLQAGPGVTAKKIPSPIPARVGRNREAIEYTLELAMKDGSFESFARAEQIARERTWDPGVVDASETLFQVPPDPVKAKKTLSDSWSGAEKVNLDVFRPGALQVCLCLAAARIYREKPPMNCFDLWSLSKWAIALAPPPLRRRKTCRSRVT